MPRSTKVMSGAAFLAAALAGADAASAALLTGSVSTTPPTTANLTTDGTVDWAIWDYQVNTAGTSGAPSNRRLAGTAIGNMTAALGTPRGVTGTFQPPNYTYTNGTSPVSATNAVIGAVTDTSVNILNSGFNLNITGVPGTTETVKVYVDNFNAVGNMTATLAGATTYTDSTPTSINSTKTGAVYTFTFQPDSAGTPLQLNYKIGTLNTGGSSNVSLQAVSVGVVPEPAVLGLAGAAGLLLLGRRRKAVPSN